VICGKTLPGRRIKYCSDECFKKGHVIRQTAYFVRSHPHSNRKRNKQDEKQLKEYREKYYAKHKEQLIEKAKKWQKNHPEKAKESADKFRKSHPDYFRKASAKWRKEHPDYYKNWCEKHPDYKKMYAIRGLTIKKR
jgi:hypothetical protein